MGRRDVPPDLPHERPPAAFDDDGGVVFKAELGTVSSQAVQVQGVWMNPDRRGEGLSAAYMAAVTSRLSLDDVVPRGQRVAFQSGDFQALTGNPTGPPVSD